MNLNARASRLCDRIVDDADTLRIASRESACGTQLIDLGIAVPGGLEAGRRLAEICMADLAQVQFVPAAANMSAALAVMVSTDHPLAACMASQYAGWQVASGKFFAMASGPMRAAAAKEALFEKIGLAERPSRAVGILETRKVPPDEVCRDLARQCGVEPDKLTLLMAPTASPAGLVQVVARSIETAMHKLFELGFDLARVESGWGVAPLPPAAADDLDAIGRTNDAILYGADVTLWVRGDDDGLRTIGPRVPSCASSDYGRKFSAIFERYERDFYRIDPQLLSPAVVTLANRDTGRSFRFGQFAPEILRESFDLHGAAP